jgi:hypothetical protein
MKPKITIVWPTPPMPMTFMAAHGRVQIIREMSHRWIVAKKL